MASARGFATRHDYGPAGTYEGSTFPDGASISADIAKRLGLADLGIGLGTEANPAPFGLPEDRKATLTDGRGNTTTLKLNEFGSPIAVTDAFGRVTTIERNADNLVTRVTQPSDGELPDGTTPGTVVTEIDYDASRNVTAQREAVGTALERQNRFEYEPVFNNITMMVDPTNTDPAPACGTAGVTCFEYDARGNRTKVVRFVDGAAFDAELATYDTRGLAIPDLRTAWRGQRGPD